MRQSTLRQLANGLKSKGFEISSGLTATEADLIVEKFAFVFPPDLRAFLCHCLPQADGFPDWRTALHSPKTEEQIRKMIDWPLEGLLFDVRMNTFWHENWGAKPKDYSDQVIVVKKAFATYPKLIPIYSHRYIPERPHLSGNPIFSVYQTDVIVYGNDLTDYLEKEFSIPGRARETSNAALPNIEFWTFLTEQ